MCGSVTLILQKGNLFVFQVIFFDEKRGEYECIAVSLVRYVILAISVAKIDFIVFMASLGVK